MNSATPPADITIFKQLGFKESSRDGVHAKGTCPFCGKKDHFSINFTKPNRPWDCKKCGRSGGYTTFVNEIVKYAQKHIKDYADELATDRGLTEDTFIHSARAGYLPSAQAFLLPVYAEDGALVNVKIYDHMAYRNASGMTNEMYGNWWAEECKLAETLYVCEGEWDTLAMREALEASGRWGDEAGCLGVPGASMFKTSSIVRFMGKTAILLYDNDESGERGRDKAASLLVGVAAEVLSVNWPADRPKGFDIRDLWKECKGNHEKFFSDLAAIVKPIKLSHVTNASAVIGRATLPEPDGKLVPYEEVYAGYRKWLHMPNATMLDVMFGTIFVNRIVGDPLWMFIVAVPGHNKSEPLMSLTGDPRIVTMSSLTSATLVSGMNTGGADPSLLPQLDGKMLIIKEFSSILTMPQDKREEIQGILRDAYDGEYRKPFGNGVVRWYRSLHFGVLAAVTPVIEQYLGQAENAALGERFLSWCNEAPKGLTAKRKYLDRAKSNVGKEKTMREELVSLARRVMAAKIDTTHPPVIPPKIDDQITHLAQLVSMLRGSVTRDKYSREITHRAFTELGTRPCKQLYKALLGVSMFRGAKVAGAAEYKVIAEIARSSIPQRVMHVIDGAFNSQKLETTASECSKAIGLPTATCDIVLGNLVQLGALETETTGNKKYYQLKPDVIKLLTEGELVKWQQ